MTHSNIVIASVAIGALSLFPFVACSTSDHTRATNGEGGSGGTTGTGSGTSTGSAETGIPSGTGSGASTATPMPESSVPDAPFVSADAMPPAGSFCSLPGSVVYSSQGAAIMPGGDPSLPDLSSWLVLPPGFCAHVYATHHTIRQLRFAPDGDLFEASPQAGTTGGRGDPMPAIYVLPDDNHDGVADSAITFLPNMPNTQGLMFAGGFLFYQDHTTIMRVPFKNGDRSPSGTPQLVVDVGKYFPQDGGHWPKVMDIAQDGTIYITNGGSQGDSCSSSRPVLGSILKLNPDSSLTPVAVGLRNPIALRCESDRNVCIAAELAKDYSYYPDFGREKLIPVVGGAPRTDWGFPCCATLNQPYSNTKYMDNGQTPDCSGVAADAVRFFIGHTPFGLDFETGKWAPPWSHRVFVALHGVVGSFQGSRIVAIPLDPTTGLPLAASETELEAGADPANMLDFATGWGKNNTDYGRSAELTFSPDGRLFVGDDYGDKTGSGSVIWIAPVDLMQP